MQTKTIIGKISYGLIFILIIPFFLVLWAKATASLIILPVPTNPFLINIALIVGIFFVAAGMLNLWILGKGLPMNAYPPKFFVTNGVYSITRNPIYLGSILLSFSLSAILISASGFWLVSPIFTLMIIAYTVGFENERTEKIFGIQNYSPFLSIAKANEKTLNLKEKLAAFILAFVPWVLAYEAFIFLGIPKNAINTTLPFENKIPVIEFTTLFYVLTYLYAVIIPFIIKKANVMREFEYDVWLATGISAFIYFTIPFIIKQREFIPHSFLGNLLVYDRSQDGFSAAFPSFHVIWALISARYFSISFKKFSWIWYSLAVLITISCVTTGNHSILDVIGGIIVYIIVVYRTRIWNSIRSLAEHIANSWKEKRFGNVRIINHGVYAGMANFVGTLIIDGFFGSKYAIAGFLIGIFGIIGAGLWAQIIEGSSKLQRPYGYYGSIIGTPIGGILVIILFPVNFLVLMAAVAMAAPWIQISGRIRCLVQGCCHGKITNEHIGIRFTKPYSRVNKISGLSGAYLHPTQLYSIGTNIITGIIMIRLVYLEMPATFIMGIYFIMNGLARFVEEYFRGEAQTAYWKGMRSYQWIAMISIIMGVIFTCFPTVKMNEFHLNIPSLYWAIAMFIVTSFAYGVDFPNSNRRFARLTSE